MPWPLLRAAGIVVPFLRELGETRHQFQHPYVMESAVTQRELGLAPTPWSEALTGALAESAAADAAQTTPSRTA